MLNGNTPVAMSATDNQCEETNAFNGPPQLETGRRAEARWPAEPHWLLERALSKRRVTESLVECSESLQGTMLCPHFP